MPDRQDTREAIARIKDNRLFRRESVPRKFGHSWNSDTHAAASGTPIGEGDSHSQQQAATNYERLLEPSTAPLPILFNSDL